MLRARPMLRNVGCCIAAPARCSVSSSLTNGYRSLTPSSLCVGLWPAGADCVLRREHQGVFDHFESPQEVIAYLMQRRKEWKPVETLHSYRERRLAA